MPIMYSLYAANASIVTCIFSGSAVLLNAPTRSSDQRRNISRSSGRTPSMSPMTAIGSGAARSQTKSHSPRSHTASINVSHREMIDPSRSFTRLRVKPELTSLRRSRCCGSSISIIISTPGWSGRMPPALENSSGLRSASMTAAYEAAAASPLRSRNTGSFSRIHL